MPKPARQNWETGWRWSSRTLRGGGLPFGVLWIGVDQAPGLAQDARRGRLRGNARKGGERAGQGAAAGRRGRPLGRRPVPGGLHERTTEMLTEHAQVLAGLARTADFRWWGDRISLTVSIGAAQARQDEALAQLLERAQQAMESSIHAGGKPDRVRGEGTDMFAILGIFIVFAAVIGGFLMEKGNIAVLLQPAELLIIAGAAMGTLLVANPTHTLKGIVAGLTGIVSGSKFGKERYLNTLKMMYQFLNKVRKEGLLSVELDVEKPGESAIFKEYPAFWPTIMPGTLCATHCATAITGGVEPFDMDQVMELDMEVHHSEAMQPVNALTTMADALPGLGHRGRSAGGGYHHGRAGRASGGHRSQGGGGAGGHLSGILLCYGVAGPLSSNMGKTADEQNDYLHMLRVLMLSFLKGAAPMIAIEMGRRAIPAHVRPSFDEMEKRCKDHGGIAKAVAA